MTKPHVHAECIKAWADGEEVECCGTTGNWFEVKNPSWYPENQYRIKPTPDPLKEFKEAFFAGKDVQWQDDCGNWKSVGRSCAWIPRFKYRLKPIPHKWQHLIDAQAAGQVCQMQTQDGTWIEQGHLYFDSPERQYRLKPKPIKFRNFLWMSIGGKTTVVSCTEENQRGDDRSTWKGFIRWIGDWQEVEV